MSSSAKRRLAMGSVVVAGAALLIGWSVLALPPGAAGEPRAAPTNVPAPKLPHARVTMDAGRGAMVVELSPVDLPAGDGTHEPMVMVGPHQFVVPEAVSLYGARVEVVDATGRLLPPAALHHFNLEDPTRRELFLPIGLNLFAASKETPALHIPRLLFGLPLPGGAQLFASGMLANPTRTPIHGARLRLVLDCTAPGRIVPLFRAYPWGMDVKFPVAIRGGWT